MKNWNALFIRHGFMVEEVQPNIFDCKKETEENMAFLKATLQKLSIPHVYHNGLLKIDSSVVSEKVWISCVDFEGRGRGGDLWFRPGIDQPKVKELDTYIVGVVRQMNRLGLYTNLCCDGHDRRQPLIGFKDTEIAEKARGILLSAGVSKLVGRHNSFRMNVTRNTLLDLAETLSQISEEWLEEGNQFIRKQFFLNELEQLLSIPGESGNEEKVRKVVLKKLRPYVDYMTVDRNGNILAQKKCGSGNGPTILLNAHMDTYDRIEDGRKILKNSSMWSSDRGILGADDRAGIAIILEVARNLQASEFHGIVKFIFTVEEEIGLVGARSVDDYFLWDVDAAIVADRRGIGDIVTSCGGYIPFCNQSYGEFFEEAAERIGLSGWKTTAGGSSDTRIWAEHGIQSVNLSAGYSNEHTSSETLDTEACHNTVSLILEVFRDARALHRTLRQIEIQEQTNRRNAVCRP